MQGQESNELPALRRQLADTEKAIDNMLNAIQAGIFNASTKRRLDELEATKEKLELSIIKEEMKKPQFTREQIQFYILQFRKVDTNTLEGRRRLIDDFVNSVVVYYNDYIRILKQQFDSWIRNFNTCIVPDHYFKPRKGDFILTFNYTTTIEDSFRPVNYDIAHIHGTVGQ